MLLLVFDVLIYRTFNLINNVRDQIANRGVVLESKREVTICFAVIVSVSTYSHLNIYLCERIFSVMHREITSLWAGYTVA